MKRMLAERGVGSGVGVGLGVGVGEGVTAGVGVAGSITAAVAVTVGAAATLSVVSESGLNAKKTTAASASTSRHNAATPSGHSVM